VFNADLDVPWDAWMQHAMAVQPRDRFASAEAMGQALDALAAHWDAQKERACAVPVDCPRTPATFPASVTPRSTPIKASPRQAIALFKLDSLWRPERYATSTFTTSSDDIVIDQAAGLAWQRAGSPFPRTWQQSGRYVQRLNDRCLAGCTAWRLPTIDELLTLLRPPAMAMDLCVPAVFAADQRRLWSADRRSYAAAYYVDSEMGYVGWQDFSALFHVRGVCALSEVKRS
jgi:serine/threonine-protein kinase